MLRLDNISVNLGEFSLKDINLRVSEGSYLTILGLSGAGKTVLLEIIAGLLKPDSGDVWINETNITQMPVQKRKIGLVYQDLCLFPHKNVKSNIAYALKNRKMNRGEINKRIDELLEQTGISHLKNRYPDSLSGGEAQRVALARTLASNPEILLLDEPLASLDVKLKAELRSLLRKINETGKTVLHVTHDYTEAVTLSSQIAVIENGNLMQTGTPEEIFRNPKSEFVARLSGYKNLFPCKIDETTNEDIKKAVLKNNVEIFFTGNSHVKGQGFIVVPSEDIIISEKEISSSALNHFKGILKKSIIHGNSIDLIIDAGIDFSVTITHKSQKDLDLKPGKEVWLSFKASAIKFIKK